jgi:hypothetical protein
MASKDLNAILKIQVDAMDLNTAPKLIIIWHLLSELLPPNKRLALSREIKISKTNYFPKTKVSQDEKYFCDFLLEYSKYVQNKIESCLDLFSVYEGSIKMENYLSYNVCDMKDVTYLELALDLLKSLVRVSFLFKKSV